MQVQLAWLWMAAMGWWEGPCNSGEGYVGGRDYVVQGRVCGWEGPCSSGEGYVGGTM